MTCSGVGLDCQAFIKSIAGEQPRAIEFPMERVNRDCVVDNVPDLLLRFEPVETPIQDRSGTFGVEKPLAIQVDRLWQIVHL